MQVVRRLIERSPMAYCLVAAAKPGRNRNVVSRSSDIVIEGYPRSGNTFLVALMAMCYPEVEVASHLHHEAHLARSLRLGIPAMVVVRDPVDAVASQLVYSQSMKVDAELARWTRINSFAEGNQVDVELVSFDTATHSPRSFLATVAALLDLDPVERLPTQDEVFSEVEALGNRRFGNVPISKVSRPDVGRREAKCLAVKAVNASDSRALSAASSLYRRLVESD